MSSNNKSLLLTLGHNSSAILVEDGKIICGYEEERLSKVKSDSAFPRLAIMECLNYKYCDKLDIVYISYWNDSFDIFEKTATFADKHYDRKFLNTLCKHYGCTIKYLSPSFTHHDAHAYAALNFFENHATEAEQKEDFHVIVADGFGNREEVVTIYKRNAADSTLERIDKVWDYFSSVGLMYQYATGFCGMKMNEDEYKFLGYESHIKEVLDDAAIAKLYDYSDKFVAEYIQQAERRTLGDSFGSYIDVSKLAAVQEWWNNEFNMFLGIMDFKKEEHDIEKVRCVIAAFIQNNIEQFIGHFLKKHNVKNVILSGGIFYNVKLNNFIMNHIPGKICVYPLAGDQGAALGFYRKYHGKFELKSLFFGKRDLHMDANTAEYVKKNLKNFEYYEDRQKMIDRIVELVSADKIVNIMTDDMEFGPRALGSTTTMALPTRKNVSYINQLNLRNDVMPMAPQILKSKAYKYFGSQVDRIIGSNFYMIITMDQLHTPDESYIGISHKYPLKDVYSSRCQLIDDDSTQYVRYVLNALNSDFVTNTSNNAHGRPILMTLFDAIRNHEFTAKNDTENRSYSIIGAFC